MFRAPFEGLHRKLVVAIDVGTTFSGVSYCVLDPGQVPEIRGVNRYPAQENVGGDLKVPTILWYDQSGNVKAAGAEATREGIDVQAEEENWVKAEWFKVYLRPKETDAPQELDKIPPLPLGKTIVEVFADFIRYIFNCTKLYIQQTHASGKALWESFEDDIHFVLSHPNGYEGPQQSLMRQAAVLAGLVPDDEAAQSRISLVTEGEASLHYCIQSGLTTDSMKDGNGVMIVDAGGGTIDFSSYAQDGEDFSEIAASKCIYNGSVFVTSRARIFFEGLLKDSRFAEDVGVITDRFDKKTKPAFRNMEDNYWIQFTNAREKDVDLNIKTGQLRVEGSDIASFFDPSIEDIVNIVDEQTLASSTNISSVFLVGGFAASDYMYTNIKDRLEVFGMDVSRPDSHVNKAVAHGSVSYYLDHRVKARVSKYTFGIPCNIPYRPKDEEHVKRKSWKQKSASGAWYITGSFDTILPQNTQVAEIKEFRRPFGRIRENISDLRKMETTVMCYRGTEKCPEWTVDEPDMYTRMCSIEADLGELCETLKPQVSNDGEGHQRTYYRIDFEIALLFGLTEFQAVVIWKDKKGEEHRCPPAKVKFDPADAD